MDTLEQRSRIEAKARARRRRADDDQIDSDDEDLDDTPDVALPFRRSIPSPSLRTGGSDYATRVSERRSKLLRKLLVRLSVFVFLPTLVAGLYYGLMATPRYVSEAQMTIHAAEGNLGATPLAALLGGGLNTSSKEIYILATFVTSQTVLDQLDRKLDLRGHYSAASIDWIARLPAQATREAFLGYYQGVVETEINVEAGSLIVRVEAFSPEYANAVVEELVRQSERLLNDMAKQAREDMMMFARGEMSTAEERLRKARMALTKFRNTQGDLDPLQVATSLAQIAATIEGQLTAARVERTELSTYMRGDSARMKELDSRIKGLEEQLADVRQRLTGQGDVRPRLPHGNPVGQNYTEVLNVYGELTVEEEFARQAYEAAARAVEIARTDAARKHGYVVDFVPPNMPDQPIRPQRLLNTLTVFGCALLAYLIGAFVIGALREHADI